MATSKYSAAALNAMLDAFETLVGTLPVVKLRSGAPPTHTGDADTGTVLATIALGTNWMDAASGAIKSFNALPLEDASADNAGTIGHFRLYDSGGVCHDQGDVTSTGGGGAMTVDNPTVVQGQKIDITSWQLDMSALI